MTGIAFPSHRRHTPLWPVLLALAVLLLAAVVGTWVTSRESDGGDLGDLGDTGEPAGGSPVAPPTGGTSSPTTAAPTATEVEAIAAWLEVHRSEVFTGNTDPYKGECPSDFDDAWIATICSHAIEDLGDHQIHTVGVFATDWGADLLLERTTAGWAVIDGEGWPELGAPGHYGPRWSPLTAIGEWWALRYEELHGRTDAAHLRSCEEAVAGGGGSDQPILCSTLVRDNGATRVYSSGRAGRDPEVYLRLSERADHTWAVTAHAPAHRDGVGPILDW